MTNMESLYGSGKFTEIMQSVKLTAINGKRLINDFPDIDLNRRYIVLEGWKLQDITYSKTETLPEPHL